MILSLKDMGFNCKKARRARGYTQLQVAFDTNYCVSNIAEFEAGRNNNALLLMYYIKNFFDVFDIKEFMKDGAI